MNGRCIADQARVEELLGDMGQRLQRRLDKRGFDNPAFVGIRRGGVEVMRRLAPLFGGERDTGELGIHFYRDDFSRIGLHPRVSDSDIGFDVEGRTLVLVDDVLYTGRTVRAAINELFDYGRPRAVLLAVLAVRDGRQLPVAADVWGLELEVADGDQIQLEDGGLMLKKVESAPL